MLPTSIYGSKTVPIRIYVIGHVTPEVYDEIETYISASYYMQGYLSVGNLRSFFGNIDTRNVPYTKIELAAPSKFFKADLWFSEGAPAEVSYAAAIYPAISNYPWIMGILLVLIISALTGALTGFIIFRETNRYALVGLANIFTIVGLAVVITLTRTKKVDEELKKQIKEAGLITVTSDPRKILFVFLFSILFLIFGLVVGYLIKLPLIVW